MRGAGVLCRSRWREGFGIRALGGGETRERDKGWIEGERIARDRAECVFYERIASVRTLWWVESGVGAGKVRCAFVRGRERYWEIDGEAKRRDDGG